MNALIERIKNSDFGVFYQYPQDRNTRFFTPKDNLYPIKVKRVILRDKVDGMSMKLIVSNTSSKRLRINSVVISEFNWDIEPKLVDRVLVNGWVQSSDSGYIEGIQATKKKKLFLKRDQNPYSFKEEFGYIPNSCVSEWYTQINLKDIALLAGAISVDKQFCQFYISSQENSILIRSTAQFDGITLAPGESIETEEILFLLGNEKMNLRRYADTMKNKLKYSSPAKPLKGVCCSYYAQGNVVDYKYIEKTVKKLNEITLPEKRKDIVVQLDAGYCKGGDWLDTNESFGNTLLNTAQYIKESGYIPGIWISPFVVEKGSNLFKEHRDWFIKYKGKPLESRQTSPVDVIPLLALYVLDVTKDEVQQYIKEIINKFKEYGYSFIKIDFLYPSCFAQAYSKNVTRAQAIRMGVSCIREASGEDGRIMSAISHLSPLVGLVDYARTGLDTSNPFVYGIPVVSNIVNDTMLKENLDNYDAREFYDSKLWINDIDCLVVNPNAKISQNLIEEHYHRIKKSKAKWIGDDISKLDKKLIDKYIKPILNG